MATSKTQSKAAASDEEAVITPEQQAMALLKGNKPDHYNFEDDNYYRTAASSLTLTIAMDGGHAPGAHRALGITTGGKTSCTLDLMFNFLKNGKGYRGVYVKSEGRLPPETKERSGITYVTDATEWKDGTCLVLESNVYEFVFSFIGDLIRNNPTKTRYFIIVDSMDMMGKRDDLAKPFEEAGQVAGGALLTSVFFKKTSAALSKRGHYIWFISQVREAIKLNPYDKTPPRQGNASGAHATEHAGDWVLEFLPRFSDDIIREVPSDRNSKILGHYCRAKVIKSNNERYGTEIRYPIRYGRKNGTSVWVEREIIDLLIGWEQLTRKEKGSWLSFVPTLREEVKKETGFDLPEKVQGIDNAYRLLEDQPEVTAYLRARFVKLVLGK